MDWMKPTQTGEDVCFARPMDSNVPLIQKDPHRPLLARLTWSLALSLWPSLGMGSVPQNLTALGRTIPSLTARCGWTERGQRHRVPGEQNPHLLRDLAHL